jgi:cytochrome P450
MGSLASFDRYAPDTLEDPYPFYAALRREAPVHRDPRTGTFWVSRHEDLRRVVMSPEAYSSNLVDRLFSREKSGPQRVPLGSHGPRPVDVLATVDAPGHTRQRKLVNPAFAPRRVAALEPVLRELAQELLGPLAQSGRADWMETFARPFTLTLITDLLGLPRADIPRLRRWSDDGSSILSGINTAQQQARYGQSLMEFNRYLAARFEDAKVDPREDVLGTLVGAANALDGAPSAEEVVAILVQLVSAGNESTASLIGSATRLLLEEPQLEARLRRDPALIPRFIEETLRLESPFQAHFRIVRSDTELAGAKLRAGSQLMLLWGSGNRDERVFSNPDGLDLERPNPGEQLALGMGIHHCIGAALARLEARVALETLLAATRSIRLDPDHPVRHRPSVHKRQLESLHLELEPA